MKKLQTIIALLTLPLIGLAGGVGWGYAKSDLEERATGAGRLAEAGDQITGGALALACGFGLIAFSILMPLIAFLQRPETTGRRVARAIGVVLSAALLVAGIVIVVVLYPKFQEMVLG